MRTPLLKRLRMIFYCLGAVALYALMPVMLLLERLFGGGPRRSAWAGPGRRRMISAFVALTLYNLGRAVLCGRG